MNRTKLVLGAVVFASALLAGCSNTSQLDALNSKVDGLTTKVDQLSGDVSSLHSDVQSAKDDAARANQRLDNQAHSYRK